MNALKKIFRAQPIRAAWRTFWQAFIALFAVSLLSFLWQVVSWANETGAGFPDTNPLLKGLVSATAAALIAVVTGIWNALENKVGTTLPGAPRGGDIVPKP